MKNIFLLLLVFLIQPISYAQVVFNKSIPVNTIDHLLVSNIDGDMEVSNSTSGKIEITVISSEGELHESVSIEEKYGDDYAAVYLKMHTECEQNKGDFDPKRPLRIISYHGNCNWNNNQAPINLTFKIKLPASVKLYVSTINNGNVVVKDWDGLVWANNVNGSIRLERVRDVSYARTVNGPVDVEYTQVPKSPAIFGTINGDIRVKVPGDIKATTNFKTFSGDFYTDQESIKILPTAKVTKNKDNKFKYKVENTRGIEIGGGGVLLDFDTFNGSAYLTSN